MLTRLGRALRLIDGGTVEDASLPRKVSIHVEEQGSSGTEIYSGYYSEEYLSKIRGTQAADLWDQMRRSDPKVKMCLSAVKNPILGAHWTVEPGVQGDAKSEAQADLIEQILFRDLGQSWTEQLKEILTFLDFGFSLFEVVHKVVTNHSKFGSYNSLAKLAWRSPRTIERWDLDPKTGKILSVNQLVNGDLHRFVDIPGEFLLVFSNEKEGDNYEGVSALRPCYGPWVRKNTYLKLMAVGIEKFAVPTPYMDVPEGKENSNEYERAKTMLEKFTNYQKQYILKPAGWTLGFASPSNFDASKVRDAIDKENNEMAQAFLENFLELGQSGSGSYALSNDLSDFFLLGIEHVAKQICETLNRSLIPDLVKLNFGPQEEYPKLTVSGIKDKPGKEYADILKILADGKIITPDKDLEQNTREKYGLPKAMELPAPAASAAQLSEKTKKIVDASRGSMNKTAYLVIGCPGSGKTWVCSQLEELFNYVHHDLYIGMAGSAYVETILEVSKESNKPLLIEAPFSISQIKDPLESNGISVVPVFIQEADDVIAERYFNREKRFIPAGHLSRQRTYAERASAWGSFSGTSSEVYEFLKAIGSKQTQRKLSESASKLSEGKFTLLYIQVSKEVANTAEEAKLLAQQVTSVDPGTAVIENETHYRVMIGDPIEVDIGTTRDFSPMKGVTVYYAKGKLIPQVKPTLDVNSVEPDPEKQ